jgi:hypothetical protein
MKSLIYSETNIGSRRIFDLRGGILRIEKKTGSRTASEEFDMARASPAFARLSRMNSSALNRSFTYLAIVVAVASFVHSIIPVSSLWLGLAVLLVSSPALHVIFHFLRPVDYVQFKDKTGKVLFDIVRTKKKARELDDFVVALQCATASERTNQPAQTGPGTSNHHRV